MSFLHGARSLIAAVALAFCLPIGLAQAQSEGGFPNAAIGVIDVQKVLLEAKAAQGARKDREAYAVKYTEMARKDEQAIHEAQGTLAREADQTSDAFRQKRQAFDKQVAEYQRKVTTLRQNLDRAMAMALDQVQNQMFESARDVAAERGINLVMKRAQLLLFDPRMDITQDVLERVDATLPAVSFTDPETLTASEK